jgi:5-methylcytosine-specific restriction enzyme subunit McrC
MIVINEQYGYKKPKVIKYDLSEYKSIEPHKKLFKQKKGEGCCYEVTKDKNGLNIEASYFVGVDWFVEDRLPIYIQPKLNKDLSQVNYIKMLFDALNESENFNHLDHLCKINFDKPTITIDQTQDLLSPLLVIQYLQLLRIIVQKGLKKSYYPVVHNLNTKIKGKILINSTFKNNHSKNKMLFNYCQYDEFGINTIENKILKKALLFCQHEIQNINGINPEELQSLFNYIQPAFYLIDDNVEIEELKSVKSNPLYKEYKQALILAQFILRRYGYTISTIQSVEIQTPPFWIDMSKLFELYIFSKLKKVFPLQGEVKYHIKTNRQELDFIISSKDKNYQMVVDAKYKPQYKDGNISKEDIRQVSGYARMKSVYKELQSEHVYDQVIDCLIIYSDQKAKRKDFVEDNFEFVPEDKYVKFYKIGIELPTVNSI